MEQSTGVHEHRIRFASSSEETLNESEKVVGIALVEGKIRGNSNRLHNVPVIRSRGSGVSEAERQADFENALDWLRRELQAMQTQDRVLAKQLIGLRSKIQNITKESEEYFNDHEMDTTDSTEAGY